MSSAFFVKDTNPTLAYNLLYWGSLILALGNGTVEAFINPLVATMFSKEKTKWLNILHAGWPGGLVIAGIITILLDVMRPDGAEPIAWWIKVALIGIPAIIYFIMLFALQVPRERACGIGRGVTRRCCRNSVS